MVESNRLARVGWWDFKNSFLRLSAALFSTSLDPSNEMSDSVGWLLLSYILLVFLLVCSISQLSYPVIRPDGKRRSGVDCVG